MVLIRMLFRLLNNPQLIEKLSESRPIRRGAQITAFAITKAQLSGKDTVQRLMQGAPRDMAARVERFKDSFVKDLKTGVKEIKSQMKNQDGK